MGIYYRLRPEVAGGLGERSVITRDETRMKVQRLHYEFMGWLGDEILRTSPCIIVTARLATLIEQGTFTGYTLREVEVAKSDFFLRRYPQIALPDFSWLDVTGEPGVDDFGLDTVTDLVVSERALATLRMGRMDHCEVEVYAV